MVSNQSPPVPVLVRVTTAYPVWGTTAVRLDGVDVTDAGIDLGAGAMGATLEIELTNRLQEVAGTVAPDAGRTAGEARDPEILDRLRARAREVSLAEGEIKTIDLAVMQR
jgi:hypothetical protein